MVICEKMWVNQPWSRTF